MSVERLHELLRAHWRAVRVPEGGRHHVLNCPLLAISELNERLLWARLDGIVWLVWALWLTSSSRRGHNWLHWLAVPLWITEVMVRLHEVVDREVVLPVEEAGAAADDLLELDHGLNRPHQNDVPNVPCVHASGELLRGGEDRRDHLLVVLEVAEGQVAKFPFICGHADAVARVRARLHLVD